MKVRKNPGMLFARAHEAHASGDIVQAFELYQEGAVQNDQASQNNLATFYESGLGTRKNLKLAKKWYLAAWRNKPAAFIALNIAELCLKRKKRNQAIRWLRRAIALGDGDAALALAKLYLGERKFGCLGHAKRLLSCAMTSQSISPDALEEARCLYKELNKSA